MEDLLERDQEPGDVSGDVMIFTDQCPRLSGRLPLAARGCRVWCGVEGHGGPSKESKRVFGYESFVSSCFAPFRAQSRIFFEISMVSGNLVQNGTVKIWNPMRPHPGKFRDF